MTKFGFMHLLPVFSQADLPEVKAKKLVVPYLKQKATRCVC